MSILFNIHSVAKYESKLLTRSWFYRIFMILAILFLSFFNFVALVSESGGGNWLMRALPANIPYINLMLLNTGQAIVAVFLSSEFLKSDKKLDTSEVFYVHSLSNAEYVIGKIWGNLSVFLRLNLIGIVLVVIFNFISGVAIDWMAYVVYFLLICIPTLIYIFGLSITLMLVFKSQAVTFVLLLGYIALTLFYIGDKFYYLFDYMVYNLPLVKSTIVGFSNWSILINHRMIYLMLGLGFICTSIFMFRRLPNTNRGKYRWLGLSFVFFAAGLWASYNHVGSILNTENRRQLFTELNNRYVNDPKMVVDRYDISLNQHPKTISSEVEMHAKALERASVFTFTLNPGLQVNEVVENNKTLSFTRDHQILLVDFGREIAEGDSVRFKLKYEGTIDESFCYLDIPSSILQEEFGSGMFKIDKKYSFQDKDYLLFTPETYWYPRPGTSYSNENPDWQQAYFSHFHLKVKTINGLKALSQGTMKWPIAKRERVVLNADNNGVDDDRDGDDDTRQVRQSRARRNNDSNDSIATGRRRPMRERPSRETGERGERRERPSNETREGRARREGVAGEERASRRGGERGSRQQGFRRDSIQASRGDRQAGRDSLSPQNR
ncbi:MAG: xanthan lyase, partial [Bacteroidales bacterium]|nr:xanthan lyase [Bacteroidales bacterium]